MERQELEEKISELDDLALEVKSSYRSYFEEVQFGTYRTVHNETGKSVRDRRVIDGGDPQSMSETVELYEEWFSQAEVLVKNFYPQRLEKFRDIGGSIRKLLTLLAHPLPHDTDSLENKVEGHFSAQIGIVNSLPSRKEVSELKFRKQVKENLALEEVKRAQRLFQDDLVSPAGVLAGVALERHLKTIMDENEETESDFDVDIGEAADELYENGIISKTKKKELIHYAGVRNDCAHAEEELDEIQVEK